MTYIIVTMEISHTESAETATTMVVKAMADMNRSLIWARKTELLLKSK